MPPDAPAKRTTDEHDVFSGKRKSPRRGRHITVRCIGPAGRWYAGRTVDISQGGMLVEITDPDFIPLGESRDLIPFAARVALQFPQGMDAAFGDGAVQVHANVVRLVSKVGGRPLILLGCQFDPALSEFDCRLLGLDVGTDETSDVPPPAPPQPTDVARREKEPPKPVVVAARKPAAPEPADDARAPKSLLRGMDELCVLIGDEEARWRAADGPATKAKVLDLAATGSTPAAGTPRVERPRPEPTETAEPTVAQPSVDAWAVDADVVVHLFPANAPLHGPRFSGKLVALRGRTAVVDLPAPGGEDEPAAWAAGLGASARVVCLREGRVLWDTRARVVYLADGEESGWARVTLQAMRPPPLHTRKTLGLAAGAVA
jgi:hypothetical protein